MKVLSIGNSFSQDAQRYLHQIAKSQGVEITCVNLYIGACSMQTHYNNSINNQPLYDYEINGKFEGKKISLSDALLSEKWDFVTLQQVSNLSYLYSTYIPYAEELKKFVLDRVKNTKIFIHETWAYENGSEKLASTGFSSTKEMFSQIVPAYNKIYALLEADGFIPSGEAMLYAYEMGLKVYRDTFHASLGLGRYMLGLVWYKAFTNNEVTVNTICELDENITLEERKKVIEIVNKLI